jgi:AcrR family transcriptional regulator
MVANKSTSEPRRAPRQARSRNMVAKIVSATAQLLRTSEPELLTTNLIAQTADVSKGSIYQYFANKEEIITAAVELLAAKDAPVIENLLQATTLDPPEAMMASVIDILTDYTISNRQLFRFLSKQPEYARTFEQLSGVPATLRAISSAHASQHRDRYRSGLSPNSIAWLFHNMATATTTRYLAAEEPIPLEDLRNGLKFAAAGLLAEGHNAAVY